MSTRRQSDYDVNSKILFIGNIRFLDRSLSVDHSVARQLCYCNVALSSIHLLVLDDIFWKVIPRIFLSVSNWTSRR